MSHALTLALSLPEPARTCIGIAADTTSVAYPTVVRPAGACNKHGQPPAYAGQRGVALVTALILLVVITLVGLAAVRGTVMQQKMAANFSDRQIAFQVGEAGLRQAHIVVQALQPSLPPSRPTLPATIRDCSPKAATVIKCMANPLSDGTLPAANIQSVAKASFDAGNLAAAQPQYVIEYMGNFSGPAPSVIDLGGKGRTYACTDSPTSPSKNPCADFYRITVRSGPAAGGDRATVVLQSVFRR
ncbi:PilX N-terminal domain-containing pilus assembly protein [Rhodanobacter sp. C06]|uniref:pilus assembly PilX family protein n=1 Tax=Rhodanobacter sp. C06 TaxID=1945854 RepID=UPI0020C4D0FB|nr:PilX N-terminal domain-containing pilus assembly protein [Rhodanobacter sp. C06]